VKDDTLYLIHVQECLRKIKDFTAGGRNVFFSDLKTQDAVLRNLQTLSESTQRLSNELKSANGDIPWQDISDFRNVLVHDYLGVNPERVWEIVEHHLPGFSMRVDQLLRKLKPNQ
jgi:uncharacterized protein with HEPN domain